MSQYDTKLHRFITGEIRAEGDPFKSPWKLDLEQWQKDHPSTLRPKLVVKSPKPRVASPRGSSTDDTGKLCSRCNKRLNVNNLSGECHWCARHAKPRRPCKAACGGTIIATNKSGYCVKCWSKFHTNRTSRKRKYLKLAA